jgi:hypothetical protein
MRRVPLAWFALGALVACSAPVTPAVPAASNTQLTFDESIQVRRQVVVLIVDDEPTAEAASLRSQTDATLRHTFERQYENQATGLRTDQLRVDLRAVVVHPSIPGSGRAIGPSDDPALAVVSEDGSRADADALSEAVARDIDAVVAPPGAPYMLLDATRQTLDLVDHVRAPADAHEAALLASLGEPNSLLFAIVTSRDDGGTGPVERFAWRSSSLLIEPPSVVSPIAGGNDPCPDAVDPALRLGQWLASSTKYPPLVNVCNTLCLRVPFDSTVDILGAPFLDFGQQCFPAPLLYGPDGRAQCLIRVTNADDAPCSTYPGMLDPRDPDGHRSPQLDPAYASPARLCEIEPVPSAQTSTCSAEAACPGCDPGWCVAAPGSRVCPSGSLRFVRGAVPRGSATIHVACDLDLADGR